MKSVWGSSVKSGFLGLALAGMLVGGTTAAATPIVVIITPSPAPPTPTVEPTPEPTPTVEPTVAPTDTLTPAPTASPASGAAGCTGTADNQAFFVEAAAVLHFDVYCAVLPKGWWLQSGEYKGSFLQVQYKKAGGATLTIWEGAWCPPTYACASAGGEIGPASFGGLAGTLYFNGSTYTIQVGTSAHQQYRIFGFGITQAQFVAWAGAVKKVPKA